MGTKQQTTQANTYNPASMSTFNSLQPQIGSGYSSLQNNPLGNPFVSAALTGGVQQAQQQGQGLMNSVNQNAFGGESTPGFTQALQQQAARGSSGLQQQAYINALTQGAGTEANILSGMSGFKPLQTGGNTTAQTTGLGTWLPQLLGAGLGAAGSYFGMQGFGGGGNPAAYDQGGGGWAGSYNAPSSPSSPGLGMTFPFSAPSLGLPSQIPGGANPFNSTFATPSYGGGS
jgi:hypothetical protein